MGWMELLPLLRRLLPLMGRLTPLVETYVAARGASIADAQATQAAVQEGMARLTEQMQANADAAAGDRGALRESLQQQQAQLTAITHEVRQLRVVQEEAAAQTAELATQIKALAASLRLLFWLVLLWLLIAVVAGIWLNLHRHA